MNEELTARAVAPIELPPPPEPRPQEDPIAIAVIAEVVENGYEGLGIEEVIRRAGVSKGEFSSRFESLEHCALDSFERVIADYEQWVGTAFNGQMDWPSALRAAAYATTDWMEENPQMTSFGLVDVLKMPAEMVRVRREETFDFCARMIDRGREVAPDSAAIPDSAAVFAIGTISQLLTHRLQEEAVVDPPAVVPELMVRVVDIYLGPEVAELEWTAERPPRGQPRAER